jgi:uncharacterized DUF497 family protein
MRLHENFEWDENEAQKNLKKHAVSFDDAALVLGDEQESSFTSRNMTTNIVLRR